MRVAPSSKGWVTAPPLPAHTCVQRHGWLCFASELWGAGVLDLEFAPVCVAQLVALPIVPLLLMLLATAYLIDRGCWTCAYSPMLVASKVQGTGRSPLT